MKKNYTTHIFKLMLITIGFNSFWLQSDAQCNLPGLLHRYDFNNNMSDSIGTNNALGTIATGALEYTTDRFGNANSAIKIIQAGNASVLPLVNKINGNTNISVSFWFKGDYSYNGFYSLVASSANNDFIGKYGDANIGGGVHHSFGAGLGYTAPGNFPTTGGITLGAWTNVTITKSASNITKIYYNGVQEGANFTTGTMAGVGDSIAFLFGYGGTGANGLSPIGSIDDYKIYNYVLSDTDVSNLYSFNSLAITQQPQSDTFCLNRSTNHSLTIGYSGTPDSIQWFKDGVAIANATNATLVFNPILFSDTANYTAVLYNNYCGVAITSTPASLRLRVQPILSADIQNPMNAPYNNLQNLSITDNNANGFYSRYSVGNFAPDNTVGVVGKAGGWAVSPAWQDTNSAINFWYQYNSATTSNISYLIGVPSIGGSTVAGFSPLAINTNGELGHVETGSAFYGSGFYLPNNSWYNFTVNFKGTYREIYINGTLIFTYFATYNLLQEPIAYIGNTGQGTTAPYRASMGNYDDINFYNYALTDIQTQNIFNQIVYTNTFYQEICGPTALMHFGAQYYSSDSNFIYRWFKDNVLLSDNAHIWGTNTNFLWFDTFKVANDGGIYRVEVSNGCQTNINYFYYNYTPYIADSNEVNLSLQFPIQGNICDSNISISIVESSTVNPTARFDYYNGQFTQLLNTNNFTIPKSEEGRHVITYKYPSTCTATLIVDIVNPTTVDTIYYLLSTDDCGGDPDVYFVQGQICADSVVVNQTYNYVDEISFGKIASITPLAVSTNNLPYVGLYNEPATATTILANTHPECNVPYMNKSWAIAFEPGLTKVRLYYTQADLDALKLASGCTNCTYKDLILTQISPELLYESDCDPNNNSSILNYYIFWNKDSNNTANEFSVISNVYNNSPNGIFGNISGNVLGACTSGTVPGGYYFEVVTDQNSEFRLHMLNLGTNQPLNINALQLAGFAENNNAQLQWSSIANAIQYTIQKSTDTKVWSTVAVLKNNIETTNTYTDENLLLAPTYYKIIAKTNTGNNITSNTILVKPNTGNTNATLYPNPSTTDFAIHNALNATIRITDSKGTMVYTAIYDGQKIKTNSWANGLYNVSIIKNKTVQHIKMQKQ